MLVSEPVRGRSRATELPCFHDFSSTDFGGRCHQSNEKVYCYRLIVNMSSDNINIVYYLSFNR